MPFKPGNQESKNRQRAKPYQQALRMELAAAGDELKELRAIARVQIDTAKAGDLQAINAIADRLDGKPAQESTVNVIRQRANELSDDELADIATGGGEGTDPAPIDPSRLN